MTTLNPRLEASFAQWESESPSGDAAHRERLEKLVTALRRQLNEKKFADIVFVCTHNSRRSHIAQLLGLAAARRKGLTTIQTFSGGTETTAFNPRAVAALERVGFEIALATNKAAATNNPHYRVRFGGSSSEEIDAYSKRFDDPPNPVSDFIVVMTCSQADNACPIVEGAVARVALPYEDPKAADGTSEETVRYDERTAQIGRDLAWTITRVAQHD